MKLNTFKETAFITGLALALNAGCKETDETMSHSDLQDSAASSATLPTSSSASAPQIQTPKRKYLFDSLEERPQVLPNQKMPDSLLLLGDSLLFKVDELGKLCIPTEKILSLTQGGRLTANTRIALSEALESNDPLRINPRAVDRAVVLSGTNDIGSKNITANETMRQLREIYVILHRNHVSTLAMTVPPFEGYRRYMPRFDEIEAKRKSINEDILLFDEKHPDWDFDVLDLAATEARGGLANDENPRALAASADASDHLHIKKTSLGHLINQRICKQD